MADNPRIENAPGLIWRQRKSGGRVAIWQARRDIIKRGWPGIVSRVLWRGEGEPEENSKLFIADICRQLQTEMLVWARGGVPMVGVYAGTLRSLIDAYQNDPDSSHKKIRYRTRVNYDLLFARINRDHGDERLSDIGTRVLMRWYEQWRDKSGVSQAHSLIAMLRLLCKFGRTLLEAEDRADGGHCVRVGMLLHDMRFKGSGEREVALSAEQATAVRHKARELGRPSIALAQAIQFDLMLRQRDVIGEWIPLGEPPLSVLQYGQKKWLRGIQWQQIDGNMILRHVTSKRDKPAEFNLRLAPMIMEELYALGFTDGDRSTLLHTGPIIIDEDTLMPWDDYKFRRQWRKVATAAGIPKNVCNCDSRAGGITEATQAGAKLEHIRHAATHSDIAMTQRYAREAAEKTAHVMRLRAEHRRTKSETK